MKKFALTLSLIVALLLGCQPTTQTPPSPTPTSTSPPPTTTTEPPTATPLPPTATSLPTATPPQPTTTQPTTNPPLLTSTVDIDLFLYKPRHITITAGTKVTWINHDAIQHTVTNGEPGNIGPVFDSDFFYQDETFAFTFPDPGQYTYFCQRHPHMLGTVTVEP